jgi:hypothetical protein
LIRQRQRQADTARRRSPWADEGRTPQQIKAALAAIPPDSVTARTAGALRVSGPRRTIADERAAFEQAVAEENAGPTEG